MRMCLRVFCTCGNPNFLLITIVVTAKSFDDRLRCLFSLRKLTKLGRECEGICGGKRPAVNSPQLTRQKKENEN